MSFRSPPVSLQVECLLSLKWLRRLARRKTNSKMDQICQLCLIAYLLHHSRNPVLPQQVQAAGWDQNHVLVVPAPVPSQQQHTDWSLFDVIGMENRITCYKEQMLPKLKITGKLIEEICSPSSPRLEPVRLKPNRDLCVFPAVAVAPPFLYGANLSYTWTHGMKQLQFSLEEQSWCSVSQVLNTHHWLHLCAGAHS